MNIREGKGKSTQRAITNTYCINLYGKMIRYIENTR